MAVKYGELDFNGHPNVGLMVALDNAGNPMWRCSGTLMSPRLFLTAGHCTDGAARITIWFDSDVESGIPGNGYPFEGQVSGTPITHPLFPTAPFFVNDVGIVILDDDFGSPPYAVLPQLGELDRLARQRGLRTVDFTSVGYGLQFINPVFVESARVRMVATPHLIQINTPGFTGDFSILLSNNHSTGGTCFGDSGGPNFLGSSNVVAGVTSFGINGNCAGTGGVFRMDTANVQNWLAGFGLVPPAP
ncbi:MAG: trypsin-like serine protease [Steroidobacteraceae bacterium]